MKYTGSNLNEISFPLGGIGTGSIGLAGNGRFIDMEIFNRPNKGSIGHYTFFAIRAEYPSGKVISRILQGDITKDLTGSYSLKTQSGFGFGPISTTMCGFPHFKNIEFEGRYPMARIRFFDDDFPADIELEAYNPFIPHDAKNSSIPCAIFNLKIIKDNRLIEIDQGIFTGRSKDDITEEEKKLKFARSEKCGMESYQRAYDRTKDFVAELIQTCKFDTVLIITHNVNASFVEDILKGVIVDFENANHVRSFNNSEMKCFDIK